MTYYIKKFAGTLVAAWILFLLLAYLYYFEIKKPVKEDNEVASASFDEKQIDEIRLQYPTYTVVIQKGGGGWFVVKRSKEYKADGEIVSGMIKDFDKMKIDKVVSEAPDGLAEYGLDNPRVEIVMK